jgi:hypothetical protein
MSPPRPVNLRYGCGETLADGDGVPPGGQSGPKSSTENWHLSRPLPRIDSGQRIHDPEESP